MDRCHTGVMDGGEVERGEVEGGELDGGEMEGGDTEGGETEDGDTEMEGTGFGREPNATGGDLGGEGWWGAVCAG